MIQYFQSYPDLTTWTNPETQKVMKEFFSLLSKPLAKSDKKTESWLPLSIHLLDCMGIMHCLLESWLPDHFYDVSRQRIADQRLYTAILLFLAAVHDLGKDSAGFQVRLKRSFQEETWPGEDIHAEYLKKGEAVHHSLVVEMILQGCGCSNSLAAIAGAHHGAPHPLQTNWQEFMLANRSGIYGSRKSEEAWKRWKQAVGLAWVLAKRLSGLESDSSDETDDWNGNLEQALSELSLLPELEEEDQILMSGLLIMADWLSSSQEYFPLTSQKETEEFMVYPNRILNAWKKADLSGGLSSGSKKTLDSDQLEEMFQRTFGFSPYPLQTQMMKAAYDVSKQAGSGKLLILEAPMGMGKTEAALAAAEVFFSTGEYHGFFFGLPTQATANGLFRRAAMFAKEAADARISILLAHGQRELQPLFQSILQNSITYDDRQPAADKEKEAVQKQPQTRTNSNNQDHLEDLYVSNWMRRSKTSLLPNVVVGTVDQLLMSILRARHFMLRHIGLAGKVVIIDEVHAYDAYMNRLLDTALAWLGRYQVPVILLSATLSAARRADLVQAYCQGYQSISDSLQNEIEALRKERAYPILVSSTGTFCKTIRLADPNKQDRLSARKVRIEKRSYDLEGIAKEALDHCLQGKRVGVIVNTVKEAQRLYQILSKKEEADPGKCDLLLVHSRFTQTDRSHKEAIVESWAGKESQNVLHPCIVIGTQVLEQSLDIDFDLLFTEICPMDLLLQRIGRLHRHPKRLRVPSARQALCIVFGKSEQELYAGTKHIYGEWILEQTLKNLPESLMIPDDIPNLIASVYDPLDHALKALQNPQVPDRILSEDRDRESAAGQFEDAEGIFGEEQEKLLSTARDLAEKSQHADQFHIHLPKQEKKNKPDAFNKRENRRNVRNRRKNLQFRKVLNNELNYSNKYVLQCTRESEMTLDVCLLKKCPGLPGGITLHSDKTYVLSLGQIPSQEEQLEVLKQKIKLPRSVFENGRFPAVFEALMQTRKQNFTVWQKAPLLKHEFFMVLDENGYTALPDMILHYDAESGLSVEFFKDS